MGKHTREKEAMLMGRDPQAISRRELLKLAGSTAGAAQIECAALQVIAKPAGGAHDDGGAARQPPVVLGQKLRPDAAGNRVVANVERRLRATVR